MSILNRWRQFGKRYFWPHLLLGVVAAGIGSPSIFAGVGQQVFTLSTTASVNSANNSVPSTSYRRQWLEIVRQGKSSSINPWHQHSIRSLLTRLSFVFTQYHSNSAWENEYVDELSIYDWALVSSLNKLLSLNNIPVMESVSLPKDVIFSSEHVVGLWLVQQGGLRAGPVQYI